MYEYIERFYAQNRSSLIEGDLRPVKSFSKEPENYIEKLKALYKKKKSVGPFKEEIFANELGVTRRANTVNETLETMRALKLVNRDREKGEASFTDAFVAFVKSDGKPLAYIFNLLCSVKSLDTISPWTNLIICSLREGYKYGEIIDFPDDAKTFDKNVKPRNKKEYLSRIENIYGYSGRGGNSDPYTPNITQRSLKQLINLGFVVKSGTTQEEWNTYKITPYGDNFLRLLNLNFGGTNVDVVEDSLKELDNDELPKQKIYFGAPGTGKSKTLNDLAKAVFDAGDNLSIRNEDENIKLAIQKAGKDLSLRLAIGVYFESKLKKMQQKDIVNKYSCSNRTAYIISQGTKINEISNKLSVCDKLIDWDNDDSIKNSINNKLKSLTKDKQASYAAIGYRYSQFFDEMTYGDIEKKLGLSGDTTSTVQWINAGAKIKEEQYDTESKKEIKHIERVTFHPNYTYAHFVGTYKPIQDGKEIAYKYVPGPFMRTYVKAKQAKSNEKFLLLIEEINRANAAAVFGDVFQLLDRKKGASEYSIAASEDIKKHLKTDCGIDDCEELKIPDNMYIWATMNSADQGVFPMDTAFKRRWDFEYIDINHDEKVVQDFWIPVNDVVSEEEIVGVNFVRWNKLRRSINDRLTELEINEDKLMGPFFINTESLQKIDDLIKNSKIELTKALSIKGFDVRSVEINNIPEKTRESFITTIESFRKVFCSKVLMYLFEDAARMHKNDLFKDGKPRFSSICESYKNNGLEVFDFGTLDPKEI